MVRSEKTSRSDRAIIPSVRPMLPVIKSAGTEKGAVNGNKPHCCHQSGISCHRGNITNKPADNNRYLEDSLSRGHIFRFGNHTTCNSGNDTVEQKSHTEEDYCQNTAGSVNAVSPMLSFKKLMIIIAEF